LVYVLQKPFTTDLVRMLERVLFPVARRECPRFLVAMNRKYGNLTGETGLAFGHGVRRKLALAPGSDFVETRVVRNRPACDAPMTKRGGRFPLLGTIFTVHATRKRGHSLRATGKRTRSSMRTRSVVKVPEAHNQVTGLLFVPDRVQPFTKGAFKGTEYTTEDPSTRRSLLLARTSRIRTRPLSSRQTGSATNTAWIPSPAGLHRLRDGVL